MIGLQKRQAFDARSISSGSISPKKTWEARPLEDGRELSRWLGLARAATLQQHGEHEAPLMAVARAPSSCWRSPAANPGPWLT